MASSETHDDRMGIALEEARKGRPSPNPHVGAAVVRDGEVVAVAHHDRAGEDHAEVVALREAGPRANGATVYATLEPCNHDGRTPPCVDALLGARVARVVIGCLDPNPHVRGGGAERLRRAGVEVIVGVREAEALALIAPWAKFIRTGVPHVAVKLALSLDGRIASRTGASKWVTGPEARLKVQELRSRLDAAAIGVGTALADDPRLTVRDVSGPSPVRVVFDTKLRTLPASKLCATAREVPTWIVTSADAPHDREAALVDRGVEVLRVATTAEGRVDIAAGLAALGVRGIVTLLVEGGAEIVGTLLAARHADELHAFVAPVLLGPRGRPGAVDWAGPDTPGDAPRIVDAHWELVGNDAYVHGKLAYAPARGGAAGAAAVRGA